MLDGTRRGFDQPEWEPGRAREGVVRKLPVARRGIPSPRGDREEVKVSFQADKKGFKAVKLLQRFETQYRSPQLSLWSEEEVKWLLARRLPARLKPSRQPPSGKVVAQLK